MMKNNTLFNERYCLTYEAMRAFANQALSKAESKQVEEHLTDCPFCADAMEGLQNSDRAAQIVAGLKSDIHAKTTKKSRQIPVSIVRYPVLSIAASIVLLIGLYFLMSQKQGKSLQNNYEIAQTIKDKNMMPPLPTKEAGTRNYNEKQEIAEGTLSAKKLNQEGIPETKGNPYQGVFTFTDEMPEFPGGIVALDKRIRNGIEAVEEKSTARACGIVYVNFIVDEQGRVAQPKVVDGKNPNLDPLAIEVIKNLPDWKPGRQSGQKVKVAFTLPIRFGNC